MDYAHGDPAKRKAAQEELRDPNPNPNPNPNPSPSPSPSP
jgi:hypothetical protein